MTLELSLGLHWFCVFLAGLSIFFVAFASMSFIVSITYALCCLYRVSDVRTILEEKQLPGVSIVKPLLGTDPLLEENLESHFKLSYPKFELLFCLHDDIDPAVGLIKKLMNAHPEVDARLLTGGVSGIVNPMVMNMAQGYDAAKYDLIWISSSRVKVSTEIMCDMVAKVLPAHVSICHQMPFATDRPGFSAALEKVYFGTNVPRTYLTANAIGANCVTGMSYIVKKELLDSVGGLRYYGKYLAEDFFLTKSLHDLGFRHKVAAIPAQQNIALTTVRSYKERLVRWGRLRINHVPIISICFEPWDSAVTLGLFSSWGSSYLFNWNPWVYLVIFLFVYCALDYALLNIVQRDRLPFNIARFFTVWCTRELLHIVIMLDIYLHPHIVQWGFRKYFVEFGGLTQVLKPNNGNGKSVEQDF